MSRRRKMRERKLRTLKRLRRKMSGLRRGRKLRRRIGKSV